MERKALSGIMLTLLLMGMLPLAFNIQPVKASGTIYIRADGSIDPPTANITTVDNVTYTFTGNINDSIVIERDNIVVDGASYTLEGTGAWGSKGIGLSGRSNVTIKNTKIKAFYYGIWLYESSNNSISGNSITANNGPGIRFYYSSNYNSISGNNITNNYYGIYLDYSSNYNSITGNNITNNWPMYGIYLEGSSSNSISGNNITANEGFGIWGDFSNYNSISGNSITANNRSGIVLYSSSGNSVFGNNVTNNYGGIGLTYSSNNVLRSNNMTNNKYNFRVGGYSLENFMNDINVSNTVDGKPVYYLINQKNLVIDPSTYPNFGYLALVNSTNITANGLELKNNGEGILFAYTTNSTITKNNITNNWSGINLEHSSNNSISGNKITNNEVGIYPCYSSNNIISGNNITANNLHGITLTASSNNTISGNNITANNDCGIRLYYSSNNTISGNNIANNSEGISLDSSSNNEFFHNNFINNTRQVYDSPWGDYPSINVWDNGYPSGGNYWSNYTGIDSYSGPYQNETGSDGIGDTPHVIDGNNQDNYPLMYPFVGIQARVSLIDLRTINVYVNGTLLYGNNLTVKFYSYSDTYETETTIWSGTTPAHVVLSLNVPHPLNWPIENATLVLTDKLGNVIQIVTSFLVRRPHLFGRIRQVITRWPLAPSAERITLFKELVDISKQWPYAPP